MVNPKEPKLRFGAGIWLFGQFVDRYATDAYGPPVDTLAAIQLAGTVGELEVVDLNYPFSDPDITVVEVAEALAEANLRTWCVTPHIYTQEFRRGAFTNPDRAVRHRALELCEDAVAVAKHLGAHTVKLWPGQDGFDYPFQVDYRSLWKLELDGVRHVADIDPEIRVAIEYKGKEPRTHMSFSTAARTLLGIQALGRDDVGLVVDLGHSLFAKETPADVVSLVHDAGRLFTIEMNDNWREWDDDMVVGSVHMVETLEFLQELRKINWTEPILLDQFPFREDPVDAARTSIATIRRLDAALDRVGVNALAEVQEQQDALAAHRLLVDLLF